MHKTGLIWLLIISGGLLCFPAATLGENPFKTIKDKAEDAINKTGEVLGKAKDALSDKSKTKTPAWWTNYTAANRAASKNEWEAAITLYKKAIAEEPRPKTWKAQGKTIGYYPYLKLGKAYLAIGDFEAAHQNCTLSQEKGVAPKQEVKACLDDAAKHVASPAKIEETRSLSTPEAEMPEEPETFPEEVGETLQPPGNVYVVIIGIGKYKDDRIVPLRFSVNDAQGLYEVLISPNYGRIPKDNVKLLLNEEATIQNIKSAIGTWLKQQTGEQDMAIIYYAGHGATDEQETYWVTYEANIDDLYATALSNNVIADMLSRIQSKRVITFLDSCYSAATVKRDKRTRILRVQIPWDKFMGEGRVTISASNGEQLSLELDSYEHGVFTYYLIEGLRGKADGAAGTIRDGIIELDELWNYIKLHVTETARKQGNTQTPVFQGSVTDRIPLSYDIAYLQELEKMRVQEIQEKQAKLQKLFEAKEISAANFDCAFRMLEAGKSDGYLEGLLAGDISPGTFERLFKCEEKL